MRNPDPIPEHYTPSIYIRTDYIVNSDMSIPLALARSFNLGVAEEIQDHPGMPPQDRRPHYTPLVLQPPPFPTKGR